MSLYILYIIYDDDEFYNNTSVGVYSTLENAKIVMNMMASTSGALFRVRETQINDFDDLRDKNNDSKFTYYWVQDGVYTVNSNYDNLLDILDGANR